MRKPKKPNARKRKMIQLRCDGLTLDAIAALYGISKQRVYQILGDIEFKRVALIPGESTESEPTA